MALTADQKAAQDALNSVAYKKLLADQKAAENLKKQEQATARTRYDQTFMENLRNLGWVPSSQDPGQADTAGTWDYGQQRAQGLTTKAGSDFWNQLNDFSARGASRSTEFDQARNRLGVGYNQQKSNITLGRTQDIENQTNDFLTFQRQQEAARSAALEQAKQAALTNIINNNRRTAGA
jgi:hypothetical protein